MVTFSPPTHDYDVGSLGDGVRAALIARAAFAADVATVATGQPTRYRIFPTVARDGAVMPYAVYTILPPTDASSYGETRVNALVDVALYAEGDDDTTIRRMVRNARLALFAAPLTATGWTQIIVSDAMGTAKERDTTERTDAGKIIRGRMLGIRVFATAVQ